MQFALVEEHINKIRQQYTYKHSQIIVFVERNLGQEAAHHASALQHLPGVKFRVDQKHNTFGVLMTEQVKYAMCTLVNNMLREQRIALASPLVSRDEVAARRMLKEQLTVYSMQFKEAENVFGKMRQALSGKVGGMCDDVCVALQLSIYYSKEPQLYA